MMVSMYHIGEFLDRKAAWLLFGKEDYISPKEYGLLTIVLIAVIFLGGLFLLPLRLLNYKFKKPEDTIGE